MRKILRERSRNLNREVWESPSVLRRRGCQLDPSPILALSMGDYPLIITPKYSASVCFPSRYRHLSPFVD
ncbi:MAG: hypothetical protein IM502_10960 [Microcystis sp. M045S2]|nr:hypothetical protein [Microcystis sp. M045S2]